MGSNKEHLRLSSLKKWNTAAFRKDCFLPNQTSECFDTVCPNTRHFVRTPHESVCCRSLQGLTTRIVKYKILSTTMSLSKHQQGRLCLSTLQQIHAENTPLALRIHFFAILTLSWHHKNQKRPARKFKAGPCHWSWMFLVQACWESTDIVGACKVRPGSKQQRWYKWVLLVKVKNRAWWTNWATSPLESESLPQTVVNRYQTEDCKKPFFVKKDHRDP